MVVKSNRPTAIIRHINLTQYLDYDAAAEFVVRRRISVTDRLATRNRNRTAVPDRGLTD